MVDKHDSRANNQALKIGARLLSAYRLKDGTKVWMIAEVTLQQLIENEGKKSARALVEGEITAVDAEVAE